MKYSFEIPMFGLGYQEIFRGILSVPHNIVMDLSNVMDSFIEWRVGSSAGVVCAQGGGGFWRKQGWFWVTNGRIFGNCGDGVGSCLQWKKWKSRDRFKKLEVSDFKFLLYIQMMCNLMNLSFGYV
jgi:hypothetical protein